MLKLIAFSKKRASDLQDQLDDESNRKKSSNMLFTIATALDILEQVKAFPFLNNVLFDVIFCTGEGELIQTFEFYKNLANGERARPLVFQNSLHSSTLGALSLSIAPIASGMTVSNGDLSFEMALDLALSSTSSNPIIIIGTDIYNDKALEIRNRDFYKNKQIQLTSGSCGGLFLPSSSPFYHHFRSPSISDIEIKIIESQHNELFSSYYPSSGLESVYEKLKASSSFTYNRPTNYQIQIITHAE